MNTRNITDDLINQSITLVPVLEGFYNILSSTVPEYKLGTITEQTLKSLQARGIRCLITEAANQGPQKQLLFG